MLAAGQNIFSILDEDDAGMRWYVEYEPDNTADYITIAYDKKDADPDTVFNTPHIMILGGTNYLWIQKRISNCTAGLIYDDAEQRQPLLTVNAGGDAKFWGQFGRGLQDHLKAIGQAGVDREVIAPHSTAAAYELLKYLSQPGDALIAGGFLSGTDSSAQPFRDSAITDRFFSGADLLNLRVHPAAMPQIEVDLRRDWLTVSQELHDIDELNPQLGKLFHNALNRTSAL